MSISSQIDRINKNIQDAYSELQALGLNMPSVQNSDNLATTISEIGGITPEMIGAVPTTRTVNGKALSSNISLGASDVGAVPTTRTVNGKALSSNITLSASDVGARANTWTPSASDVGAVPTSRTINGKALTGNITLSAADVGAATTTAVSTAQTTANNAATAASNAQSTANSKASTATYTATIPTTGWSSSAPYTVAITVSGILATDNPVVDVVPSSTAATAKQQIQEWGKVGRITTAANQITVYCYDGAPTVAIPIQLKVTR